MRWIEKFQLFLFDFDGLLVNTEEYHFRAYKKMMADRGVDLTWDFSRYCQSAHYTTEKFRTDLFHDFPELAKQDPHWEHLYKEKQKAIKDLLHARTPDLMPGVVELLSELQKKGIAHCVVTHSPDELVSAIRHHHPVLNQIPYWITRHDYTHPKPNPECYELAISRYSKPTDQVIGFEDAPRGLQALLQTKAKPILVTEVPYPEISDFKKQGVLVFRTLVHVNI